MWLGGKRVIRGLEYCGHGIARSPFANISKACREAGTMVSSLGWDLFYSESATNHVSDNLLQWLPSKVSLGSNWVENLLSFFVEH